MFEYSGTDSWIGNQLAYYLREQVAIMWNAKKKSHRDTCTLNLYMSSMHTSFESENIAINLKQPVKCMSKVCQFLL